MALNWITAAGSFLTGLGAGKTTQTAPKPEPPKPTTPSWVIPAVVAGGAGVLAIVLVVALRK